MRGSRSRDPRVREQQLRARLTAGLAVAASLSSMIVVPLAVVLARGASIPAREWFGFAVLGALHAIPVGFLAGLLAAHVPVVRAGVVAGLAPLVALLGGLGAATAPLFPLSRAISQSLLPGVTWSPAGLRAIPIGAAAGIVAALLGAVLLRRWLREARADALAARTPEHAT